MLAPLFAVRGTSFASLQYGPRAADLKKLKRKARDRRSRHQFEDFVDTAAADRRARSRHHRRYVGRASRRRARQAGLGVAAVGDRLALAAQPRGQSLVSDHAAVPPEKGRGLGRRDRARRERAESRRAGRQRAADAVQGRRRAPRRAGRRDHGGGSRASRQARGAAGPSRDRPARRSFSPSKSAATVFWPTPTNSTRRAAAAEPDNAEAAHMLGIIAHQSGKTAEAIEHMRRAIAHQAGRCALPRQSRRNVPARRPHRRGDRRRPPRHRNQSQLCRRTKQSRYRAVRPG